MVPSYDARFATHAIGDRKLVTLTFVVDSGIGKRMRFMLFFEKVWEIFNCVEIPGLYIIPLNGYKQEQQQKPPSSDCFKSPVPKAREKWATKKSGGQKGHKGHTLEPVANSNHLEVHKVGQCAVCGVTLEDTDVFQPIFRAKLKYP